MMKKLSILGAAAAALLFSPPLETRAHALAGLKATASPSQVTLVGHRAGGIHVGGMRAGPHIGGMRVGGMRAGSHIGRMHAGPHIGGGMRHGGFAMRHGGHRPGGLAFRHGPNFGPGKHFRHHPGFAFNHGKHFRHHRRFYALPYVAYPYYAYSYSGGGCYWLKERAIVTGSSYWWRRYDACRYDWD